MQVTELSIWQKWKETTSLASFLSSLVASNACLPLPLACSPIP